MTATEPAIWKNRIVGHGEKPAKDFRFNPAGWRTHPEFQRRALDAILSEVGWVNGVIENVTTGFLLDGHARIEQALAKNADESVPFIQVELSEEEERKILAVLDPIGGLATTDDEKLRELSEILDFESSQLAELVAQKQLLNVDLDDFWQNPGAPPPEKFIIELEFTSPTERAQILGKLGEIAETPGEAVKKLLSL